MDNQFYAYLSRMKYISRWSLMHNSSNETLSEHTLQVAILTHALCVIARRRFGRQVDTAKAVLCALYHDAPEIITGDLPTPVKYYNPAIRDAYREIEQTAAEKLLSMLPQDLEDEYRASFFCEDREVLDLVKAADKLGALIKCLEEERMGNREFVRAREATEQALREMDLPEVKVFMKEFLPAYTLTLDELE